MSDGVMSDPPADSAPASATISTELPARQMASKNHGRRNRGSADPRTVRGKVAGRKAVRPKRLLDINTATASQLTLLRRIGPVQAARIVAARPFSRTQELVTRGVISEAAYDRIASELTVNHG